MSADNQGVLIRSAKNVSEVSTVWWPLMKELGWDRDRDDAITHFHVANKGQNWLLLLPKETKKPEGCIVAFTYPNGTGWVGFFIINAPFRGHGLGRALWRELEASFRSSNTLIIGLDAVEEQMSTYRRRGFQARARIHLMTRDSYRSDPLPMSMARSDQPIDGSEELKAITWVDPQLLAKMDLEHTGLDRSAYWSHEGVLSRQDAYGFALMSSEKLAGFILVRRSEHGHRFGPLYADSYAQARSLLYAAVQHLRESNGSMIAEVFGTNQEGRKVFEEMGFTWAGLDYHRMWLYGRVPKEQQEGGKGAHGMFAIFDAGAG